MNFFKEKNYLILLLLLVVFLLLFFPILSGEKSDVLKVSFLDVGQGDAIFIESPNGNQILIDGGKDNKILRALSKEMKFYDREIDFVLSTHPDCDHIGGLPVVFERYRVLNSGRTGVESDTMCFKEYEKSIESEGIESLFLKRGEEIKLGSGVSIEILFPDRSFKGGDINPNDSSLVLLLKFGENEFLLSGDAPKDIENFVLLLEEGLEADVLKVGHHGSKTSTSRVLLGVTSPLYAVISVGADNYYRHPHEEVIQKLQDFNIKILETSKLGSITFTSDGHELELLNQ